MAELSSEGSSGIKVRQRDEHPSQGNRTAWIAGSRGSRVAIETERAGPAGAGAEGTRPPASLVATFWGPLKGSGSESGRGILGDPEEPHPGRRRADRSGKRDPHAVTRKSAGDAQTIFK